MLSTHKVEVVPIKLEKHPNADTLSVVQVFGGFPCCVRTADWKDGDLAAYIPPDSVVDVGRPEFVFLAKGTKTKHRIRTVKLRGVQSFGLLVKAPEGAKEGENVAAHFGVEHYEPEMKCQCTGGEAESAPDLLQRISKYDIDALRRYSNCFTLGETVMVTEKIHGANARYVWHDGRMWCGSRTEWKRQDPACIWWKALDNTPGIAAFCKAYPDCVLYGEVYGKVQSLHYGVENDVRFMAFDVLGITGQFWDAWYGRTTVENFGVPTVPLVSECMYRFEDILALAEGNSLVPGANHVREGVVVKPEHERYHQHVGRLILKVHGAGYLAL